MNNAVAVRADNEFGSLQIIAKNAAESGLYGAVGGEPKIFMILLAARELNVPPCQALNGGIWNIQGKIEISARLMNAMIRKAGHSITITHCDETKCVMQGKRSDSGDTFTSQFTMEDAKRAGIANRTNWKAYAEDMLYARAMSRLARRLFPDVIGTAYVEGEIRDAKCEVINSIPEEPKEIVAEVEQDPEVLMNAFMSDFSQDDHEWVRAYFEKYCNHWKKSIQQAIGCYADKEHFLHDFTRWKAKQIAKSTAA